MESSLGSVYLWTKLLHVLLAIAWMAAVFYLPRILVNLAEVGGEAVTRARLVLMGRRLYRFGHILFGFLFLLGMLLWAGRLVDPLLWPHVTAGSGWMHAKFLLVLLMLGHFVWAGRMLKAIEAGAPPRPATWLRWFNEVPVVLLLGILVLVYLRPF
jgi:putative membrane protein